MKCNATITPTNKYRRTYSIHNPYQSVASMNHIVNGSTQDMQITTQTISEPINKCVVDVIVHTVPRCICRRNARLNATATPNYNYMSCHGSHYRNRTQPTVSTCGQRVGNLLAATDNNDNCTFMNLCPCSLVSARP